MRKNVFLFTILILVLLSGCRQVKYIPVQGKNDSIYIEKTVLRYDTVTFTLPPDTVYSVSTDSSFIQTDLASSEAVIGKDGKLYHTLTNKPVELKKEVVYLDKIVEKEVKKEIPVIQEVEKPVRYVPGYYKTINKIFWFLISIIGGGIFLKIKRII